MLAMQNDLPLRRRCRSYVPYMNLSLPFEICLKKIVGRQIKQVLLLHANSINADHFGDLVAMLKRRGTKFITLAEALTDSAYQSPDTTTGPGEYMD